MKTELMTVGELARELGVSRARLSYALDKASILERGRAGILRLFGRDQLPAVRAALATVRVRSPRPESNPDPGASVGSAGEA